MLAKLKGITVLNILVIIKSKADNTLVFYSDWLQIVLIYIEQQIRFTASSDTGNNLNQAVLFFAD